MKEWVTADPHTVLRILFVGTISYVVLIIFLRITGKRSLSKMNAFDFIITIALGSTFATILTSSTLSLPEGLSALVLLLLLQYVVTWTSVRVKAVTRLTKAEPALLYYQGNYLCDKMRRERIHEDEIRQFARDAGLSSMNEVRAVVLETDGTLSVIRSKTESEDLLPYSVS